jgi:hypothetical protein
MLSPGFGQSRRQGCKPVRGAMWFVKISISGDKFFDAMYDMSGWLTEAHRS